MTRIIAGAHGGRRLAAPTGAQTRPTSDRVREAYFSALGTMTDLEGARFADLYAGSGAVGLEALSRGASHALLVEADARASRAIRDNIVTLRVGNSARLVTGKVAQVLTGPPEGGPFDIVFADPPYAVDDDEVAEVQWALVANGWLAEDAVVTFERSTRTAVRGEPLKWVDGITEERSRRYGETTLWYGRRS
ncbi:16S rRNA (guanine(966)-N(2))-methyltransferase RsmD [Amorphoplanes digitatis]|uniref:16S rRNA (Guanine966-N2)-methyltransferase n=1 Tax=Actinoplanes digitatis TaxID=1868 RepID=A0A7W7MNG9_9ACTN|nr:16S rRNA (guanine(966)-N(2))-methyltransferase RsmD [Actinoplanes digitatis]MBB4760324.1 16S rRNA (guanine966-N2)-methyltransferase [Actinoplanes digitatis]BFE68433.1 16S rRNA (guanine(966)-N(2))-methyltransferase RsmD [Actinoplanes digitatis]GID97493.1 DNA methylase [Actinoplanes digitatis]